MPLSSWESELWPEHLHQAKRRKVSAFLVNARISDRTFKRYGSAPRIAKFLFAHISHVFASSPLDRKRLIALGVNPDKMTQTGNLKVDAAIGELLTFEECQALKTSLGFTQSDAQPPFILLGSSLWPGEELALLKCQQSLIEAGIDCRLLLVPRHVERRNELVELLKKQALSWHQRTSESTPEEPIKIYLADTTGELKTLSQIADLAFIGKSLPHHRGGQTPIEAAGLGLPIVFGPHMENFKDISQSLLGAHAARQITDTARLQESILELAHNPDKRKAMAAAAKAWHKANRGSSQRSAEGILSKL